MCIYIHKYEHDFNPALPNHIKKALYTSPMIKCVFKATVNTDFSLKYGDYEHVSFLKKSHSAKIRLT